MNPATPDTQKMARRIELAVAAVLVVIVGVLLFLAVQDMQRRSRDIQRLSDVRTAQAAVEDFRRVHGSYPETLAALTGATGLLTPLGYAATPDGCNEAGQSLCAGYVMRFDLEGGVSGLSGGHCSAGPQGVSCLK